MFQINDNFQKLPGSYLFSTIAKKVAAYQEANPDKEIIRLGIGDVTQPLAPAIIDALHKAVDEMGYAATFHGYAPDLGYEFLRKAISDNDYKARGCDISADEIFVSDGAKSDSANIQELFSANSRIAVTDPVYPVYVDSNVIIKGIILNNINNTIDGAINRYALLDGLFQYLLIFSITYSILSIRKGDYLSHPYLYYNLTITAICYTYQQFSELLPVPLLMPPQLMNYQMQLN